MTERSRARTKSQEITAKIQQCVLVIFNSHHQHSKTRLEMSPLQIAAASALLLACVYLSVGTPETATTGTEDIDEAIIKRTFNEAINAKIAVEDYFKGEIDDYLKDVYGNKDQDVSATCSSLQDRIVLPCLQNVPGCNSTVNVSKNLNYLLYMYSHVLGFIYQSSTDEAQMVKLDYLEMIYHRLTSQMQRYLQACNLSHGDTVSFKHQDIDMTVKKLQVTESDNIRIAEEVLCQLKDRAREAMHQVGKINRGLYGYGFCKIRHVLNKKCPTRQTAKA